MEMDLEKQGLDMQQLKDEGIIVLKQFFLKDKINNLRESAKDIFKIQFKHFSYTDFNSKDGFTNSMIKLFNEHFEIFQNTGKLIQSGLIELYKTAYDDNLLNKLKELGLSNPLVCTRPVLFFNHPKLANQPQYYKTPAHQDYPSMLSSLDSVVVWIPLIDVTPENGAVIFYPKTHKLGPLTTSLGTSGFAEVDIDNKRYKPFQPSLEIGDIVIFSTLLVHESGDIFNDDIRWSCHFRYTNLNDDDFINRGFPSPYIYKSII
jgi:phytanoyl-CoA hydroxylase